MITNAEQAPGLAQTVSEVEAGLSASALMAEAQQRDAEIFILDNGQAVTDGHPVVGMAPGSPAWAAGQAPYSRPPS